MRRTIALMAAALLVAGCDVAPEPEAAPAPEPAAAPSAPRNIQSGRIEEGVGVAGIALGMTAEEAIAAVGPPVAENRGPDGRLLFLSYHDTDNFGVYLDEAGAVRLLIVSSETGAFCTVYDACLYREGDLAKIKSRHGGKLLRFVDRDGGVTYRLLSERAGRAVLTEWTPVEERDGVVQVAMLFWDGPIDRSSFD